MLLKFAYEDFIADRRFKNTTERNIQNYRQLLAPFIEYCIARGLNNVTDVRHSHIRDYLLECQERGNKPSTINSKIQRIRAFYNYLLDEKIVTENIALKVKQQKEDVKIDVFTDEQIYQMLAYYRSLRRKEKNYFSYRGYMLIVLLLGTGLRRKEVIQLKWCDVDITNLTLNVYGKNRQYETVFLTEKLAKELTIYGAFCKQYFGHENDYVFLNRDNSAMTDFSISQLFDNLRLKMNFANVRVSPHTFRHTFCHRLAMSGMSTFAIQKMMRHQNVSTTMRYVAMWGNELKEQNEQHNPLNNLDI
ncbi:tyrosine-type recombinase/integrase [Ureibacillus chungkukjangi]|uniref:Integrase/recombinase XerD n=1 Tax=Ureibacillus chungkukjangi TaxID=1202712 RepID=A0A318TRR9_9BACL|nr:tyrosine-type recombinase/integrase [Ureibacillus chungkukjangi]PYF02329.1 integrase/recombinase XerD [Ureibacillus chungkukjangi]